MRLGTILSVICAVSFAAVAASACERPAEATAAERALLNWVNEIRQASGLAPFRANAKLTEAAQDHACDMAKRAYFAHARPGGPKLKQRIKGAGYNLRIGAENLAYTRRLDPETVAGIWRNSAPHWKALTHPGYRDAGIAIATGEGRIYWVIDMGTAR